jgi:erythromycin esterase-like protein
MGIDCQLNTYNPDFVKAYLFEHGSPLCPYAEVILNESKNASAEKFKSYSQATFDNLLNRISDLQDSLNADKNILVQSSSEKEYQLYERILEVVKQVCVQGFGNQYHYRDKFMAENSMWLRDYFNGKKVVIWAHNGHISNNPGYLGYEKGSLGYYLNQKMGHAYTKIGFLFSTGSFTAVGMQGTQYALQKHEISADPLQNSLNYIMAQCDEPAFSIKISKLISHKEWYDALYFNDMQYFQIGSVFNSVPQNYYSTYGPGFFDYIIYFDNTTASPILQ